MDWTCYRKARRPVVEPRSPPHGRIRLPTWAHIHRCAVPRAGGRGPRWRWVDRRLGARKMIPRLGLLGLGPWPRLRRNLLRTPAGRTELGRRKKRPSEREAGGWLASDPSHLELGHCPLLDARCCSPPPVLPQSCPTGQQQCAVPSRPIPIPIRACLCASLGLAKEPSYRRLARPCRSLARPRPCHEEEDRCARARPTSMLCPARRLPFHR